jgi:uncharacterized protein (TIGR00297 family)
VGEWESRLAFGAVAAILVAGTGFRRRALSADGTVAAWVIGTVVVAAGGWWWGLLLVVFFVASTLLGRIGPRRDEGERGVRGQRRDAVQVGANGGLAALLAALAVSGNREILFIAYAGAIAAATADTWATEIGRYSRVTPRSVVTSLEVEPGASGGITQIGTIGALGGAILIGILTAVGIGFGWAPADIPALATIAIVTGAGFSAALVDSLLGATLQAVYRCPRCKEETEAPVHYCGRETVLMRGIPAMTNDIVNLIATLAGAALAVVSGWAA